MAKHEAKVLRMMGWGDIQAEAIAAGMDGMPSWKDEWHRRMADYCSAREQHGINCQASFLTWTLKNTHKEIGNKLRAAETEEQAHAALKEFWAEVEALKGT
jgi:hypothetical protein